MRKRILQLGLVIGLVGCQSAPTAPAFARIDVSGLVLMASDGTPVSNANVDFNVLQETVIGTVEVVSTTRPATTDNTGRFASDPEDFGTSGTGPQFIRVIATPPEGALLRPDTVTIAFIPTRESLAGEEVLRFQVDVALESQ